MKASENQPYSGMLSVSFSYCKAIEESSGTADWLYPDGEYESMILQSSSMYEEDYWRIMEKLADIHRKQREMNQSDS